jgi:hypothetical protein
MPGPVLRPGRTAAESNRAQPERWFVSRLSRERERQLYFVATVVAAAWYLVTRFL